jgi:hypothetical protein
VQSHELSPRISDITSHLISGAKPNNTVTAGMVQPSTKQENANQNEIKKKRHLKVITTETTILPK